MPGPGHPRVEKGDPSSVSLALFDVLFDNPYAFPGEGGSKRRMLLVSALNHEIKNYTSLPGPSLSVVELRRALVELAQLSDATCNVLHSVIALAQRDPTFAYDRVRTIRRWHGYLIAQDADRYRAPIILEETKEFGIPGRVSARA